MGLNPALLDDALALCPFDVDELERVSEEAIDPAIITDAGRIRVSLRFEDAGGIIGMEVGKIVTGDDAV